MNVCKRCHRPHGAAFVNCDECRAKVRAWHAARPNYQRDWISANREKKRAYTRASNARTGAAARRRRRELNPEQMRAIDRAKASLRRARLRKALIVPFTEEQLKARLSMYAACWICGTPDWTDVDHVKPLSKGGPHMLANLRPACGSCNYRKAATWPFAAAVTARR